MGARAGTAATATAAAPAAGAATDRPGTDEEIRRAAGAREPAPGPARASARALRPGGGRVWAGLAAWNGGLSEAPPAESAAGAAAAKGGPRPQRLQPFRLRSHQAVVRRGKGRAGRAGVYDASPPKDREGRPRRERESRPRVVAKVQTRGWRSDRVCVWVCECVCVRTRANERGLNHCLVEA